MPPLESLPPGDPKKILLVEDNPDILETLEATLGLRNFRVTSLTEGSQVMATVVRDRPDLIIMDVTIPKPDGYELCRELKAESQTRDIPIILMSAKTQRTEVELGFQMGADRYITKPFLNEDLLKTVASIFQKK
ncbi:MAG: response regulator [Elusimicrobia bacterium]|nr:response regulator [Elusimicrobiota bacterium]